MEEKIFNISVQGIDYKVVAVLLEGQHQAEYQVYESGNLLFGLHANFSRTDGPDWGLAATYTNADVSDKLVKDIGKAIEEFYR